MAAFAAAYRTGIPGHDKYGSIATSVSSAGAQSAVASLAAPDAKPDVCRGALGFAYTPRQSGKEPVVVSIVAVFKDEAAGQKAYADISAAWGFGSGSDVKAPTFGPDATLRGATAGIPLLFWRRGAAISFLLAQDVDNWEAGAHAIDRRLGGA